MNDENVMAMVNATKSADGVTMAELDKHDRLCAIYADRGPHRSLIEADEAREELENMAPDLLPRLVKAYRRVCAERDSGILTDDLVGSAVAKAEQDAYRRGRREAIEEAAGLARLMFPHGAAAFVAELTKGPARGE